MRDRIRRGGRPDPGTRSRKSLFTSFKQTRGWAPQFCQVLMAKSLTGEEWRDRCSDASEARPVLWHSKYPWLTFVVGSGVLGLPTKLHDEAAMLPDTVVILLREERHLLRDWEAAGVRDPAETVRLFTSSLTGERLSESGLESEPGAVQPGTRAEGVDPLGAQLTLVAAAFAQAYHRISHASPAAPARRGRDRARLRSDTDLFEFGERVHAEVVVPALRCGETVRQRFHERGLARSLLGDDVSESEAKVCQAVEGLLAQMLDELKQGSPEVRFDHLQLLTEVCWFLLVRHAGSYPGWTELLVNLVFADWNQGRSTSGSMLRPRWQALETLGADVAEMIRPASRRSRDSLLEKGPSPAQEFLGAVAECLWAQTTARTDEPTQLLRPLAFATSFDVELELAILRAPTGRLVSPTRQPVLSVVVPVYLHADPEEHADFVWLEARLTATGDQPSPGDDLDELAVSEWRVMSGLRPELGEEHWPVVVHLTGAPLYRLPDASRLPRSSPLRTDLERLGMQLSGQSKLVHAITVDEYLALRQSEAEHFWSASREIYAGSSTSRALPRALVGSANRGPARFYACFGVPLMDPAVRLRVVSQMTASRFHSRQDLKPETPLVTEEPIASMVQPLAPARPRASAGLPPRGGVSAPPTPSPAPVVVADEPTHSIAPQWKHEDHELHGMTVNARVNDDEAVLLDSLGIDVVQDRCENFTADLRHYASHLRQHKTGAAVPRMGATCQLDAAPSGGVPR